MDDRVYVSVICRRSDLEATGWLDTEEATGVEIYEEDSPATERVALEEVNYGRINDVAFLFPKIPYIGHHGAGSDFGRDFGPCELVCDGVKCLEWNSSDSSYCFNVDDDGNPFVGDSWREFWRMRKRVGAYLGAGGEWPTGGAR